MLGRSKLLSACKGKGGDLFQEIREMRKTKLTVATLIDGEKEDIAGHFGNMYSKVYNSADDEAQMEEVKEQVENAVNKASLVDVEMVTPEDVKKNCT